MSICYGMAVLGSSPQDTQIWVSRCSNHKICWPRTSPSPSAPPTRHGAPVFFKDGKSRWDFDVSRYFSVGALTIAKGLTAISSDFCHPCFFPDGAAVKSPGRRNGQGSATAMATGDQGSVTRWLGALKAGDPDAA
jgi:hypothetical protein